MSLGAVSRQTEVFSTTTSFCEGLLAEDSIYCLLRRQCFRLFPDELFADHGRRSVPPMIVAVVMVLQRIEGCSDREAVERFTYDVRWSTRPADFASATRGSCTQCSSTCVPDWRPRSGSSRSCLETARAAGLVGRRRVLDSTALYDAVATMGTVTLIRSAIRGLLGACEGDLEHELRGLLRRDDDYRTAGKPVCDYEDPDAREALVDELATRCAGAAVCARWPRAWPGAQPGGQAGGDRRRPGPRRGRRWGAADCAAGSQGSGHLPSIPRRATATRPRRAASTATRATLRSVPTAS